MVDNAHAGYLFLQKPGAIARGVALYAIHAQIVLRVSAHLRKQGPSIVHSDGNQRIRKARSQSLVKIM